jgi:hypothetical protein
MKIPFVPEHAPEDQRAGYSFPVWSPDRTMLYFQRIIPYPNCGEAVESIETFLVDLDRGEARTLAVPEGFSIAGWTPEKWLRLVKDDDGYRLHPANGTLEMLAPDESDEARAVLAQFLTLLADGEKDRNNYWQAARMFGGDWAALAAEIPGGSLDDKPKLLQLACTSGRYQCLRTREIRPVRIDGAGAYHFLVIFMDNKGNPLFIDGEMQFYFAVTRPANSDWRIMDMPPMK